MSGTLLTRQQHETLAALQAVYGRVEVERVPPIGAQLWLARCFDPCDRLAESLYVYANGKTRHSRSTVAA